MLGRDDRLLSVAWYQPARYPDDPPHFEGDGEIKS
jgi:hypothetical protein